MPFPIVLPVGLFRVAYVTGLVAVAILSLLPRDGLPVMPLGDKAEHLLAYTALAYVGVLAARGARAGIATCVLLVALGAALEVLQALVPGRFADLRDVAADAAGVALGVALARISGQLVRVETASPP
jgi:VanZ family protein